MGTPFFKWNDWIKTQLDDAVEQYKLKSPLSFSRQSQMRPDHFKSDIEEQDNSHEVYRKDVKRKSIGRRLLEKLKIKKEVL